MENREMTKRNKNYLWIHSRMAYLELNAIIRLFPAVGMCLTIRASLLLPVG